jgi:hypothetical protein
MSANPGRGTKVTLWIIALLLMFSAAIYQRLTGPTHPLRGSFEESGETYKYRLLRSEVTTTDARIALPDPGSCAAGSLWYKRYATADGFSSLPLGAEEGELVGRLPVQPAAGKLEYYLTLDCGGGSHRIPDEGQENIIIRFRGEVPIYILLPHIFLMFFAVLFGLRTGLAALFGHRGMHLLAWITLALMTVGGMFLGPLVQKYAFGAFWTGWPFGYDLTDNKMLIMWLVWLAACGLLGFRPRERKKWGRSAVITATLIMIAVYLIPHSMHGSQLDYDKLDEGVPASEAIGTG